MNQNEGEGGLRLASGARGGKNGDQKEPRPSAAANVLRLRGCVQPMARGGEPTKMKRHFSFWHDPLWMELTLPLLRLLHAWSGRHYRRTLLRRELRRISRGGAPRAGSN